MGSQNLVVVSDVPRVANEGLTFSFTPPTGRTWPLKVTSPVIAICGGIILLLNSDTRAKVRATPALGPSLGIDPAGAWIWICSVSDIEDLDLCAYGFATHNILVALRRKP